MRDGLYSYFSLCDKVPYGSKLRDKAFDFGPQFNKKKKKIQSIVLGMRVGAIVAVGQGASGP